MITEKRIELLSEDGGRVSVEMQGTRLNVGILDENAQGNACLLECEEAEELADWLLGWKERKRRRRTPAVTDADWEYEILGNTG